MKRHNSNDDHDRGCQDKEPRKQDVNETSSSTPSVSIKDILRCRIAQKQATEEELRIVIGREKSRHCQT